MEADYLIVGGGLCGCVLASRLHEANPSLRIILIEAGPDSRDNPNINHGGVIVARPEQMNWAYLTTEQRNLEGRRYPLTAGKVLGGGTALNAAAWTRGGRGDYDHWAEVGGDQRWSYEGMLPYFRKTERHWDKGIDTSQHGLNGPMSIYSVSASDPERRYPLRNAVLEAWTQAGVPHIPDGNNGSPLGVFESSENWENGKRQTSRDVYSLDGVEVLLESTVHRVLFEEVEGKIRAVGVQLLSGEKIVARKEVILSSGTVGTPKLLLLSGIGPKLELEAIGVPVLLDLPEVGKNYHDHLSLRQWWKLRDPEAGVSAGHPRWTNPAFMKGIPYDWIALRNTPSEPLEKALEGDGMLEANQRLLRPDACHTEIVVVYATIGDPEFPRDGKHISSIVVLMLPTSRGSVTLSSSDPLAPPLLDPNDFATSADAVSLRHGVRQILRVMTETPSGRAMVSGSVPPPGLPQLTTSSTDAEIDAHVRLLGNTTFHAAGTAAMGPVVDAELRVKGVEGLRVVDASVLPVPIAAHLQVALYALAEQAADIILQR